MKKEDLIICEHKLRSYKRISEIRGLSYGETAYKHKCTHPASWIVNNIPMCSTHKNAVIRNYDKDIINSKPLVIRKIGEVPLTREILDTKVKELQEEFEREEPSAQYAESLKVYWITFSKWLVAKYIKDTSIVEEIIINKKPS